MTYDSKFEEWIEGKLNIKKNPNNKKGLKLQYQLPHYYVPDFVDEKNKIIYESKGFFSSSDRTKMIAVRKANPDWRFILIFQKPHNKLTKADKSKTYAEWSEKNGFEWKQL